MITIYSRSYARIYCIHGKYIYVSTYTIKVSVSWLCPEINLLWGEGGDQNYQCWRHFKKVVGQNTILEVSVKVETIVTPIYSIIFFFLTFYFWIKQYNNLRFWEHKCIRIFALPPKFSKKWSGRGPISVYFGAIEACLLRNPSNPLKI